MLTFHLKHKIGEVSMSHTVTVEAILTIAVTLTAAAVASMFMSNILPLSNVYITSESSIKEKAYTQVEIIFATNSSADTVKIWVKNIGLHEIHKDLISKSDVFFGPSGNFTRVSYMAATPPSWNYTIVNDFDSDENWDPCETLEIIVSWSSLQRGDYWAKFVTYNGAYDEYSFSIG